MTAREALAELRARTCSCGAVDDPEWKAREGRDAVHRTTCHVDPAGLALAERLVRFRAAYFDWQDDDGQGYKDLIELAGGLLDDLFEMKGWL